MIRDGVMWVGLALAAPILGVLLGIAVMVACISFVINDVRLGLKK